MSVTKVTRAAVHVQCNDCMTNYEALPGTKDAKCPQCGLWADLKEAVKDWCRHQTGGR